MPLSPSEEAVLTAVRAGLGSRVVHEQLADDPVRGVWAAFELAGQPVPLQVAVGHLARAVDAGQPVAAVVGPIVAGPPPDALLSHARIVPTVPREYHRRVVRLVFLAGVAVGIAIGLASTAWPRLWVR